jgi:copper transport protein
MTTRARTWLAGVVLGLVALLVGAAPASAHAVLVASDPPPDTLIWDSPQQVTLTFTEAVSPVAGKVRVIAPDGSRVDRDDARANGTRLVIPVRTLTQPGTYLVSFRVVSADSHPVSGAYAFSFLEVSASGPPTATETPVGESGFVLAALPVARWIGYLGLAVLVGSALMLILLWPHRLPVATPLRAGFVGAGAVAAGAVLELLLYLPYLAGSFGAVTSADVREVLRGQYGAVHLVRLAVVAAAVVLLRAIARGRDAASDRVLLALLGAVAAGTWPLAGHPSATDVPVVSVAADLIHLASMSVWLGGLIMLVLFLLPRANAAELRAIVPVWSRWAAYAVGALVLTGVAQTLLQAGELKSLVTTTYGWVLLAKVGLVAVVLGVAWLSRSTVATFGPADEDEEDGERPRVAAGRLRRLVFIEAAVALVIIGVTSVLVQITPARTETVAAEIPATTTATVTDPTGRFVLTASLSPGEVGINQVHLFANTTDGKPQAVVEWTVRAANEAAGLDGVQAVVVPVTSNHATGQITLPAAGTWRFTFTLRLDETTSGIVQADLTVE